MTSTDRTMKITYPSPTEFRVEREFSHPRQRVWDAHTKPELIKQWLLGPDGWSMPYCEFDARDGGSYRYEWLRDATGERMGCGGTVLECHPIDLLVTTERFDEAWYPGEAVNTATFEEILDGQGTLLTVTTRFESEEAFKEASKTGVLEGMDITYGRLADVLDVLTAHAQPVNTETEGAPATLDLTYDVVELPEQRVGRIRGRLSEAQQRWVRMHELATAAGLLDLPGAVSASILPGGTIAAGPDSDYDTAIIVPTDAPIPDGLTEDRLPAGRYARATYTGPFEHLGAAWGTFTGPWLASSGHRKAPGPAFEIYRSDGPPPVTELHIPLA